MQFHGVGQDTRGRQVDGFPSVAEHTADNLGAAVLQQHGQQQTDVVKLHLASGTDAMLHGSRDIAGEQYLNIGAKALDIDCRRQRCQFQCGKHGSC